MALNQVGGFDGVLGARAHLLGEADALEATWREFLGTRSVVEASVEGDLPPTDLVMSEVDEARGRLERTQVEIGVFGQVNRGKSTLVNSLLGEEVSSMRVTPETVVPVWTQFGERRSQVLHDRPTPEGQTLVDVDPADSVDMAGAKSRRKRSADAPRPLRILQWLPAPLLRSGVVLIDTPGLDDSDPELAKDLEATTLAELDRVTAAVLVLSSPPGLSGSEHRLLKSFTERRVDKAFIVCNFYSDHWNDPGIRDAVLDHVGDNIRLAAGESTPPKLYAVNAHMGWRSRAPGGEESDYESSGVAQLERDLEAYLSGGALAEVIGRGAAHLRAARLSARERVMARVTLLDNPGRLSEVRAEKQTLVDAARTKVDVVCNQVELEMRALSGELAAMAREPFDDALADLFHITDRKDIERLQLKLETRIERGVARMTSRMAQAMQQTEQRAKAELRLAFGEAPDEVLGEVPDSLPMPGTGLGQLSGVAQDWGTVGLAAGVGAAVGGSIAGGAGLALVALGPAGFLIGAAIGALLLGGGAAMFTGGLTDQQRSELAKVIQERQVAAVDMAESIGRNAATGLVRELRRRERSFASDAFSQLDAVRALTDDPSQIAQARQHAMALLARLDDLDLSSPALRT
jgi:hypothetical protein